MTQAELERMISEVLPGASFDEDNDGQIIIYTGLADGEDGGELVEAVAVDEA